MQLEGKVFDALQIHLEVSGGIDDYAKALLAIFNKCRDDKNLLSVTNNANNTLYVNCTTEIKDAVVGWLSQFGEIKRVVDIKCVMISDFMDYDYEKYYDCIVVPYFEN